MTSLAEIGLAVKAARRAAGMRQIDLAREAGVSRYTLIKLERGQLADITWKTLGAILAPLGLELRLAERRVSGLPILGDVD